MNPVMIRNAAISGKNLTWNGKIIMPAMNSMSEVFMTTPRFGRCFERK